MDAPEYYTSRETAEKAGVSLKTFFRHLKEDVGGIRTKAREIVKGVGHRWNAAKCPKYFALVRRPSKPANT